MGFQNGLRIITPAYSLRSFCHNFLHHFRNPSVTTPLTPFGEVRRHASCPLFRR